METLRSLPRVLRRKEGNMETREYFWKMIHQSNEKDVVFLVVKSHNLDYIFLRL